MHDIRGWGSYSEPKGNSSSRAVEARMAIRRKKPAHSGGGGGRSVGRGLSFCAPSTLTEMS